MTRQNSTDRGYPGAGKETWAYPMTLPAEPRRARGRGEDQSLHSSRQEDVPFKARHGMVLPVRGPGGRSLFSRGGWIMNEEEARDILRRELGRLRDRPYREVVGMIGSEPLCPRLAGRDGSWYQIEIQCSGTIRRVAT